MSPPAPRRSPRRGVARSSLVAFAVCVALAVSSCGTLAYNRAWERFEPVGQGDPMEGRWKGEWRSEENGHSGGLRCMMTREADGAYHARFHSTYAWIFSFRHDTRFHVVGEAEEGGLRFEGAEDLGKTFGGVYRYEGTVAESAFHARYEAENGDHGVFEMRRVDGTGSADER